MREIDDKEIEAAGDACHKQFISHPPKRADYVGGAFSYVREPRPPFSVQEVIDFYVNCGFDYGLAVDHIILAYRAEHDDSLSGMDVVPPEWRERQEITLELAKEFLSHHRHERCRFTPIGIAQGWSPRSYASAFESLEKLGFNYIALGGMVPLKTNEILACLKAVSLVKRARTKIHLLGVTRVEHVARFGNLGVVSFDSTSPLRQAFKDEKDNYYTLDRTYRAIRVPQVDGNPRLRQLILSGKVDQGEAIRLEKACLDHLVAYDQHKQGLEETLGAIQAYERLHEGTSPRGSSYREVLADRPWESCPCEICQRLGIHVILFRGAERNRRRGFHNLHVFNRRLHREVTGAAEDNKRTSKR